MGEGVSPKVCLFELQTVSIPECILSPPLCPLPQWPGLVLLGWAFGINSVTTNKPGALQS